MNKLTLIRGLPGSGKSTLAKTLDGLVYRSNMYFVKKDGVYTYDKLKTKESHAWCREQVKQGLLDGHNMIVTNTFSRLWEMKPYFEIAKKLNVEFEVIEMHLEVNHRTENPYNPRVFKILKDQFEPYSKD